MNKWIKRISNEVQLKNQLNGSVSPYLLNVSYQNVHHRLQCASHPVCVLAALLCFASVDQPLPEFGRDTGDVAGAGDG